MCMHISADIFFYLLSSLFLLDNSSGNVGLFLLLSYTNHSESSSGAALEEKYFVSAITKQRQSRHFLIMYARYLQ